MIMSRCQMSVVIEDNLYTIDGNTGYLNVIDLNNRSIKKTIYMDNIYASPFRVAHVLKISQSIWIIPLNAVMIAEYNLETENVLFHKLGIDGIHRFSYVINLGTIIYLVPSNLSDRLLQFSTESYKIVSDEKWLKKKDINQSANIYMASNVGSKLLFVFKNDNRIICYDLLKGNIQEKKFDIDGGINGIAIYKEKVCLTMEKTKCVLIWDYEKGIEQKISLELVDEFYNPVIVEDRILLSNGAELFWLLDYKIEAIENIIDLKNDTTHAAHFYRGYNWRNKVILPPCHSNMFLEIDKNTYDTSGFIITIPENDKKRFFSTNILFSETRWSSLSDYINVICCRREG